MTDTPPHEPTEDVPTTASTEMSESLALTSEPDPGSIPMDEPTADPWSGPAADASSSAVDWPTFGIVAALLLSVVLSPLTPYKFFGLPMHAWIIHAAVVFMPTLAIATVIVFWRNSWRKKFAMPLAIASVVTFLVTAIAAESGEKLRDNLFGASKLGVPGGDNQLIARHAAAGGKLRWIMFAFAVVIVAHYVVAGFAKLENKFVVLGFQIVGTAMAALTMGFVIYTGHLGAEAVWQDRVDSGSRTQILNNFGGPNTSNNGGFGPQTNPNGTRQFPQRRFGRGNSATSTTSIPQNTNHI